jgi:hypothetical protein
MPTANDVLTVARAKIGLGETPPNSNHNMVTEWYGQGDGPWCAMFLSWVLAHSGFSGDGGATLTVPGVVQTTRKGWAYVPYLLNNFRDAHRVVTDPQPGDVVTYHWHPNHVPDHTGLVESVEASGTIVAIEGNTSANLVERKRRDPSVILAFCRVPYDGAPAPPKPVVPPPPPGVPPFPGYCSLGSRDNATGQVQQRLADRGWTITVDRIFGPETDALVKEFQAEKGLEVDGIVGPLTWIALWTAPIT